VIEKLVHHPFNDRAATYAVPPSPEHVGGIRYTSLNETISNNYGAQVVPLASFGTQPIQGICAKCHSTIETHVKRKSGLLVWLVCLISILFGCWFGCCLIPFCIPDIQNAEHYCPNCKTLIGKYRLI
jgi:lipopolysaccharide-induced tumor necrosis factor-alpha factor